NGYIEGKELENFFRELESARKGAGMESKNTNFAEKMQEFMRKYDKNADGKIEMSELAQILPTEENFLLCFRQHVSSSAEFMEAWRKYDTDRSGYIEANELQDGNGFIDENELDALLKDLYEKNKKDSGLYLKELIEPVLTCFNDADSRLRYYACEALYNIVKVARGSVLPHFNVLFDGLSKLAADPDPNVKSGSELLDRLLKDIVTESNKFDLVSFIPLLRERIYSNNQYARQFIISWILVLESVPDINLLDYLPEILDGLFQILGDNSKEIRKMCEVALGEFLKEIKKNPSSVKFAEMANILVIHCQASDDLIQLTAMCWMREFIQLAGRVMLPYSSGILTAVLPCLSYDDRKKSIKEVANVCNQSLMKLVIPEDDEMDKSKQAITVLPVEADHEESLPKQAVVSSGSLDASGDSNFSNTSVFMPAITERIQVTLNLDGIVQVLDCHLHDASAGMMTRIAVLKWLYHLYIKTPRKMFRHTDSLFPILLKTLSDESDEDVLLSVSQLHSPGALASEPPLVAHDPVKRRSQWLSWGTRRINLTQIWITAAGIIKEAGRSSRKMLTAEEGEENRHCMQNTLLPPPLPPPQQQQSSSRSSSLHPFVHPEVILKDLEVLAEIASSPAGQTEGQGPHDTPNVRSGQLELPLPAPAKTNQSGSSVASRKPLEEQPAVSDPLETMPHSSYLPTCRMVTAELAPFVVLGIAICAKGGLECSPSTPTMNSYFYKFMINLLKRFSSERKLLEMRGAFIIRQLCLLLNAENIFHSMADILLREEDLKFASTMVHTLNTILLTSSELFQLRNQLKDLKTPVGGREALCLTHRKHSRMSTTVTDESEVLAIGALFGRKVQVGHEMLYDLWDHGGVLPSMSFVTPPFRPGISLRSWGVRLHVHLANVGDPPGSAHAQEVACFVESRNLFCCLYRSWCHNPVTTVSLCFLTQNYKHAYDLIQKLYPSRISMHSGDLEVTVDFLIEVDKLVQLIECPIFTCKPPFLFLFQPGAGVRASERGFARGLWGSVHMY
ncbi:hypothetical protein JD844_000034, partial [Phrynosoma platyrhinos]